MKILLKDVYSKFDTMADQSMDPRMMVMSDQLCSTRPLGQQWWLKFTPAAHASAAGEVSAT
jgi:hypothetical protein